ncbi:alpha-hydroxy acid oxidase [Variovorax fucosicus]|uniref:alpha-hydroxy acid oxidase n=1 Tax=Variovorax fucosicus TaxID=3053517 RepID=UPI00257567A9|nr:alpha-hydroxy acid oxidase [Variovorax sp. J22G47]MDM0058916.1 alpha-hydroxy acid oxidase [Variovorax sp. J22G47]
MGASAAYSVGGLRLACRSRLPKCLADFYEGGAEDEITLGANAAQFSGATLWPRVLQGMEAPQLARSLFGATLALPFGIAPMGALGFGWHQADIALCRAAAAADTVYTLSTMATASLEDIAATEAPHRWFQAHLFQPRSRTHELIARARSLRYEALVVTVDLPVGGKRERDLANRFVLPFRPDARHVLDFLSRPGWLASIIRHGVPRMPNLQGDGARNGLSTIGHGFDSSFDWAALRDIRALWPGPLVLKGVLHPADARLAVQAGVDAVWVSNHGGRQLDAAVGTLEALRAVKAEVADRIPIFFDGGITRGQHILKAYALGADFVFVGRAALYGVCADGERGARTALSVLREEVVRAMQLCNLQDLGQATSLSGARNSLDAQQTRAPTRP